MRRLVKIHVGGRYTPPRVLTAILAPLALAWLLMAFAPLPVDIRIVCAVMAGFVVTALALAIIGVDGLARVLVRVRSIEQRAIAAMAASDEYAAQAKADADAFYHEARIYEQRHQGVISQLAGRERQEEQSWHDSMRKWGIPPVGEETDNAT